MWADATRALKTAAGCRASKDTSTRRGTGPEGEADELGLSDGLALTEILALILAEGDCDSETLGEMETLMLLDGESDGLSLGLTLGDALFDGLTLALGLTEGLGEGDSDGDTLGETDGEPTSGSLGETLLDGEVEALGLTEDDSLADGD